jgi:2-(1,2-epoxy-1,2-dihydrophenyl)acetyl-CoA isomerase
MSLVNEAYGDGICTLTLNRPEKKNAMSLELLEELYHSLQRAGEKKASLIVIRGSGKTFCAGGDVIQFMESPQPGAKVDSMADYLNRSIVQIRRTAAIVIAVVEGLAVGAGMSLCLACDLTIAERKASMSMAYRKIGLTPDGGGSFFLPRLINMQRFNELYFLSRSITMEEAKEMGIVNIVVDERELDDKLARLIADLKALPMETIQKAKDLVNLSLWQGLSTHLDRERLYVSQFSDEPRFQERLRKLFKKG